MIITSTGSLKTKLSDMAVGDYINMYYTYTSNNSLGVFSELGTINSATVDIGPELLQNGLVTAIKINTGLLMTCNIMFTDVNYIDMNSASLTCGKVVELAGTRFLVRLPQYTELMKACSTLDGTLLIEDRFTNFDTASGKQEHILEHYAGNPICSGYFTWNTAPAVASNVVKDTTSTTNRYARLVFAYAEDPRCTSLFH